MTTNRVPPSPPPTATARLVVLPSTGSPSPHDPFLRKLLEHRMAARRHLARRGFEDIADDALQETFLHFVRRSREPGFVAPEVPKAWLLRWVVCIAYVLRRANGRLDEVTLDAEVAEHARACARLVADHATSPDARLDAEADAATLDAWRDRVGAARESLLPQDRAALDAELARDAAGAVADAAHRKRLQRARRRASVVLGRHGIRSARPPAPMR